jgi:hypothetical protein
VRFADSDIALRRVPFGNVNPDDGLPTSVIVKNSSDGSGMSVVTKSLLDVDGRPAGSLLPSAAGFGLYAWNVGRLRELQFDVVADPVDDEPAHANVVYVVAVSDPGRPWSRTLRRELISAGWWEIAPISP